MADKSSPLVCFLTDFGLSDHYAGVLKAVLLSLVPDARIVDLTHNIPPQNVAVGAFHLLASYSYFPQGTFFIGVVDPGVGSERDLIYAEAGGQRFIAPDNGLLSWVFNRVKPQLLIRVNKEFNLKPDVSKTFHGRDILTPVVGHILRGEPPMSFGSPVKTWVSLPFPPVRKTGSLWEGEVLSIDGFGNLITNFRTEDVLPLASRSKIWIEMAGGSKIRGLAETYVSVEKGKLLAIGGSAGFIEISVRDGNAAQLTQAGLGEKITLHFRTG